MQGLDDFLISFKYLDGIPAEISLVHQILKGFFYVSNRMLYRTAVYMRRVRISLFLFLRQLDAHLGGFHRTVGLQRAHLHNRAAKRTGKCREIDHIAVFLYQINHVDGNDGRNADLQQLCGQIKVSLDVGAIDNVQNNIRFFLNQIGS